jgi:hypothetical protein
VATQTPEPAGKFRVAAGGEGRGFLVSHLDEADPSWRLRKASMMPLIPSPGMRNTVSGPPANRVATKMSLAAAFMDLLSIRWMWTCARYSFFLT